MPLLGRLVAILVIALLLALTVTSVGVQIVLRRYLVTQVDGQLAQQYHHITSSPDGLQRFVESPEAIFSIYAVYVSVDGQSQSNHVLPTEQDEAPPTFSAMTYAQAAQLAGAPYTLHAGGQEWRAVALAVTRYDTSGNVLWHGSYQVAESLAPVDRAVAWLRLRTLLFGAAVIVACTFLGWLAIRRSFRPLVEVEETAAAIAAGDLSRRVPERPATTEVGRLTRSLNGMLTQIESAFRAREASEARTRRFAADASHELRTPLVSIRGFAELYRQGAVPPDEVPRTMRRIEDEATRMGSLVEDLLLLARLDAQRPARHEPVDLLVLAADAVHDAKGLDAERTVTLVGPTEPLGPAAPGSPAAPVSSAGPRGPAQRGPEQAMVIGDEDRLRQVVANLVANAVRHTPPGTPIELAVGRVGPSAVLEVRDHGPGLSPEQAERVFERFYRVDSSRRRDTGGGSGLGLSIVAAVVTSHAGTVTVVPTPGGGATFRVVLPAADGPTGTDRPAGAAHATGPTSAAHPTGGPIPHRSTGSSPQPVPPRDSAHH